MDVTNLTQFENIMTDRSTPPAAADTTLAVDTLDPPALRTFQDAIDHVERSMDCSIPAGRVLKTALRQIAWAVAMIEARHSGQYLNPDRKALDLARMPFDLPAINQALAGVQLPHGRVQQRQVLSQRQVGPAADRPGARDGGTPPGAGAAAGQSLRAACWRWPTNSSWHRCAGSPPG